MSSKSWRRNAIRDLYRRDGASCSICGVDLISAEEFEEAYQSRRQGPGSWRGPPVPDGYPTLDHIVERWRGGTNKRDNLRLACSPCNNARSNASGRDEHQKFNEDRRVKSFTKREEEQ